MGKVAQVLIAGYWPDRVPRRVGVPQRPLGVQFDLVAGKAAANAVAIVARDRRVTYAELSAEVKRKAAGIATETHVRSTVALVGAEGPETLALFLAGQVAGCKVALLDSTSAAAVERQVKELSPDLVVIGRGAALAPNVAQCKTLTAEEIDARGSSGSGERRARWRDVAALLPLRSGFAGHSHTTVTAMFTALVTYIPELEKSNFVCEGPLHRWDAFAGAMTALMTGRAVIFDQAEAADWGDADAYGFISRATADRIVRAGRAPEWLSRLKLLFVVMSDFDVRWRRKLEGVLRRAILPIWGTQRTGPAISAHPFWAPVEVHGLPLTNTTLLPINPANGEPSEVPWEMLSRAELGVESPSVQVKDEASKGVVFDWKGNPVARTGRMVAVDRLGMIRFLDAE